MPQPRLNELMERIGSQSSHMFRMANIADNFGDAAPYRIEGGIALISITGPLSNAPWSWGGTTYGDIQNQCKIAAADPDVTGILLCINSPGGETDNAFETAAVIAKAGQQKEIYAAVSTMAYSAAYLFACQAKMIFCSPTSGGVGSIGVWAAHMDYSDMLKQAGIKPTIISAGDGKTDGNPYEPLSDDAKASMQENIDRLYGEFVATVALARKMSPVAVVKAGARMYQGSKAAISSGLADMPGDVTDAWSALSMAVEDDDDDEDDDLYPLMRAAQRAASAINSHKDNRMTAEQKVIAEKALADAALVAGKAAPTAAEIQSRIDAAVVAAADSARAETGLIVAMCSINGTPDKASGFILEKKTVAEVCTALLASKVAEDAKTAIDSAVDPAKQKGKADAAHIASFGEGKPWSEVTAGMPGQKGKK